MARSQGQSIWNCYRFEDFEAEHEQMVAWVKMGPLTPDGGQS
jgi:hypothetical protein